MYKRHYDLDPDAAQAEHIVERLQALQPALFALLGLPEEAVLPDKTVWEYPPSGAAAPFPAEEILYRYQISGTAYNIRHHKLFNGHIGDTEERVEAVLTWSQGHWAFSAECYAPPYSVRSTGQGLSAAQTQAIERLLAARFSFLISG